MSEAVSANDVQDRMALGLRGQWYALMPSRWVAGDKPVQVTRLGEKLVVWRDSKGTAHVQRDVCPHRGAPLSLGRVIDDRITCPYHGIQLDGTGTIKSVPAFPGCSLEGKHALKTLPSMEMRDAIFAYFDSAEHPEPVPFDPPFEFASPQWSGMLCSGHWKSSHLLVHDNLVDPMHGSFLHAESFTLAYGAKQDKMAIEKTDKGFIVKRLEQQGVNFDWTEYCDTGAQWYRLDIPYPAGAGPGGPFRIIGFVTPIDRHNTQVFFWRMREVDGWQRDAWRFMYRNRLEYRHWVVLEQDRVAVEGIEDDVTEMLYQHDIGVTHLRRLMQQTARKQLDAAAKAKPATAHAAE